MTHFVRDNTEVYAEKRDIRTATNSSTAVTASDLNLIRTALDDIRDYLRDGTLDASPTVTIATANITSANATTATITSTATIRDLDLTANTDPAVGPEMDYIGYNGRWFIGVDVANSPTSRDFVLTGVRGSYSFSDGVTTSGSATLTSASGGSFVSALVGSSISGTGIPNGTTIIAVGGTTSLTMSANATSSATGVRVTITRSSVQDLAYWKHRGALSPTFGIGVTPPDGTARLQVSPQDDEPAMGTIRLRRGPSQTGKILTLHDSTPTDTWWVDKDFYVSGAHSLGGAIAIQGDVTNDRPLLLVNNAKNQVYGFSFPSGGGGVLRFRSMTGGQDVFQVGTDGTLFIYQPITIQLLMTLQSALKGSGARAAAPSTGTHVAGEVVFNADPIAGGKIGWVCVTGGSPGTWKAWGAIDP